MSFNELSTYQSLKEDIRTSLEQMSKEFIVVGFYLKRIRDEGLHHQDGYADIWEFAQDTYGISKSTCSRWMTMNDRFSEEGNSPYLADEYRNFGKSQLQEMLYLSDEQLEQAKPGMAAKEIRKIRKPDPVQVFKDYEKEALMLQAFTYESMQKLITQFNTKIYELHENNCKAVMDVILPALPIKEEDLIVESTSGIRICIGDRYAQWSYSPFMQMYMSSGIYKRPESEGDFNGIKEETEPVVVQEEHSVSWFVMNYCENGSNLTRLIQTCEENDTNAERAKAVQKLLAPYGYSNRGGSEFDYLFEGYDKGVTFKADGQTVQLTYIQFVKEFEELYGPWKEKESVAPAQQGKCVQEEEESEHVAEAEYREVEPEEYGPRFFLDEQKKQLEEIIAVEGMPTKMLARQKTIVAALAAMVKELENQEEIITPGQPELPILKNNDQRRQWLKNYKGWGIWYKDENIGVTYYKYDFEDGTRLITEEYPKQVSDYTTRFHLVGGPKARPKNSYGCEKYPYHEVYTRYPDSESEMIEFLKHIQKEVRLAG